MTRTKLSAAILLTLIIMSIFSCTWVSSRCDSLLRRTDRIISLADSGDTAAASEECGALACEWEDFRHTASVLMLNSRLTDIDRLCSRLEAADVPSLDELSEMRHLLIILKNSEIPTLHSIF